MGPNIGSELCHPRGEGVGVFMHQPHGNPWLKLLPGVSVSWLFQPSTGSETMHISHIKVPPGTHTDSWKSQEHSGWLCGMGRALQAERRLVSLWCDTAQERKPHLYAVQTSQCPKSTLCCVLHCKMPWNQKVEQSVLSFSSLWPP